MLLLTFFYLSEQKKKKSNARNAMTEAEKRERRALERKLSEMEEELKVSIDFLDRIYIFFSLFFLGGPSSLSSPSTLLGTFGVFFYFFFFFSFIYFLFMLQYAFYSTLTCTSECVCL